MSGQSMPANDLVAGNSRTVGHAREVMLIASQIYNNPQIDLKSEAFTVTTVHLSHVRS
jgi:hypothetical protein